MQVQDTGEKCILITKSVIICASPRKVPKCESSTTPLRWCRKYSKFVDVCNYIMYVRVWVCVNFTADKGIALDYEV